MKSYKNSRLKIHIYVHNGRDWQVIDWQVIDVKTSLRTWVF